jgi:oligoendopeptidase F
MTNQPTTQYESVILTNEILAEVKTEKLRIKLKRQTYNNKPPFYCIMYDANNFCPVETMSANLQSIIETLENEVTKIQKRLVEQNDEVKKIHKELIDDYIKFIDSIYLLNIL